MERSHPPLQLLRIPPPLLQLLHITMERPHPPLQLLHAAIHRPHPPLHLLQAPLKRPHPRPGPLAPPPTPVLAGPNPAQELLHRRLH